MEEICGLVAVESSPCKLKNKHLKLQITSSALEVISYIYVLVVTHTDPGNRPPSKQMAMVRILPPTPTIATAQNLTSDLKQVILLNHLSPCKSGTSAPLGRTTQVIHDDHVFICCYFHHTIQIVNCQWHRVTSIN
jgi:hypothetical protein